MKLFLNAACTFLGLFLLSFGGVDYLSQLVANRPPRQLASLFGEGCGMARKTNTVCQLKPTCAKGFTYTVTGNPPGQFTTVSGCSTTRCGGGGMTLNACPGG